MIRREVIDYHYFPPIEIMPGFRNHSHMLLLMFAGHKSEIIFRSTKSKRCSLLPAQSIGERNMFALNNKTGENTFGTLISHKLNHHRKSNSRSQKMCRFYFSFLCIAQLKRNSFVNMIKMPHFERLRVFPSIVSDGMNDVASHTQQPERKFRSLKSISGEFNHQSLQIYVI